MLSLHECGEIISTNRLANRYKKSVLVTGKRGLPFRPIIDTTAKQSPAKRDQLLALEIMGSDNRFLRLVQVILFFAVSLDAFALSPGRVGGGSPRPGAGGMKGRSSTAVSASTLSVPENYDMAHNTALSMSGGGNDGKVRAPRDC